MKVRLMSTSTLAARKALVMKGMQAAIAARTKVNVDLKSPTCIYSLCEAHRVTVRFNNINMEGMYDRVPKPRIHVSALRPLARRAFTCAHELGHHVFGHGSTIDELQDDPTLGDNGQPNEVLANAFAAFVLMPTLGIREAFNVRGLDPNRASAAEIYAIACNFGVGYATLVNHLTYGIEMINLIRRASLGKITPKAIRTELLGAVVPSPLIVVDRYWNSPTLDTEEGSLLLLPAGVVADTTILLPERDLPTGRLFRVIKPGITRVAVPRAGWATYVRAARREYVGLARYRHLEDIPDE